MTPQRSIKQTQFAIFGAFATLPLLLLIFVAPQLHLRMTPVTPIVAAGAALGCLYVVVRKMAYTFELPRPEAFQVDLLIAMAFAELTCLVGMFMGSEPVGALPFAILDWLLMFWGILPRLVLYWRRWDARES